MIIIIKLRMCRAVGFIERLQLGLREPLVLDGFLKACGSATVIAKDHFLLGGIDEFAPATVSTVLFFCILCVAAIYESGVSPL